MSHTTVDYVRLMHERGFRVTPQRQLILDAVCEGHGHTTPEEIFERVRAKTPTLNRATVYRTLDFLCEMRLVVAANIGRRTVYEIAGKVPHHHLVCLKCSSQAELPPGIVEHFFSNIERETSFTVETNHLALFGLCEDCARAAKRTADRDKPGAS